MSEGTRMSLVAACEAAGRFRALFAPETYADWHIAGSIRRTSPTVGDIEHVVIANDGPIRVCHDPPANPGLFAPSGPTTSQGRGNMVWARLDELVRLEPDRAFKATYGADMRTKWGERARGIVYEGVKHEIYLATPETLGYILLIRTGPAEYSKEFVTAIKRGRRFAAVDGAIRHAATGQIYATPTEHEALAAAGWKYTAPEFRQ